MEYLAAMFDFDGTITEKGEPYPSKEMCELLVKLSAKMPIAFCTGRQLESFEKHGLDCLVETAQGGGRGEKGRVAFLENTFLVAENGAIGYFFDVKKGKFVEFYRVDWPEEFIGRDEFMRKWQNRMEEVFGEITKNGPGGVLGVHRVAEVVRGGSILEYEIEDVYKNSALIYEKTLELLREISEDYEKFLHLGDSGLGVLVCPADGDKDQGVKEFAAYLKENREFNIGKEAREILCVGDSPLAGGNDYYFLKGEVGSPFTVGDYNPKMRYPKPVINLQGERLWYCEGTRYLIEGILRA